MTTQFLGKEVTETLRGDDPSYRLREVDQTAPAGMWQMNAQGGDMLFQASTSSSWSSFTDVVTLESTPAVTIHGTLTVSGTIVFAADVRLDDDIVVLFGDDSDYYMGYSATDDALEIGTGSAIASNVALAFDSSGKTVVHGELKNSSSSFLIRAVGQMRLDSDGGAIVVNSDQSTTTDLVVHSLDTGSWATFDVSANNLDFAAATTISSTANLTLSGDNVNINPAGDLNLLAGNFKIGGTPAGEGVIRLENNALIGWFNSTDAAQVTFGFTTANVLKFDAGSLDGALWLEGGTSVASIYFENSEAGSTWQIGKSTDMGDANMFGFRLEGVVKAYFSGAGNFVMVADIYLGSNGLFQVGSADSKWDTNELTLENAYVGSVNTIKVQNSDSGNAGSNARVYIRTGGTSSGDPMTHYSVASSDDWVVGIDTSHDRYFKIANSTTLHTDTVMTITNDDGAAGNLRYFGIGTNTPTAKLEVYAAFGDATNGRRSGVYVRSNATMENSATDGTLDGFNAIANVGTASSKNWTRSPVAISGVKTQVTTETSAVTQADINGMAGVMVAEASLHGSGPNVTQLYGLYIANQTGATYNFAIRTIGTSPSRLDGSVMVGGGNVHNSTEGTGLLSLYDNTPPAGTITDGASFYCDGGEMFVINSAGTVTQLS